MFYRGFLGGLDRWSDLTMFITHFPRYTWDALPLHLGTISLSFFFNQNIQAGVLDNTFEPKVMKGMSHHVFLLVGRSLSWE